MSSQLTLCEVHPPRPPRSVRLLCCDVVDLLRVMRATGVRADLVVADPPWSYSAGSPGHGRAEDHYHCLMLPQIKEHLADAAAVVKPDAYLALWCTFPLLYDAIAYGVPAEWGYKTGGAWHKCHDGGTIGTGYHWRGEVEPLLLYVRGRPRPHATIRSGHADSRGAGGVDGRRHSEKPLEWARDHVRAWCPPGGLVLDLYAGMAPYARACLLEGRRYLGAEIDPERHRAAMGLLAQVRP